MKLRFRHRNEGVPAESRVLQDPAVTAEMQAAVAATIQTTPVQGCGADGSPLVRDSLGVRPATWGEIYEHRAEFRAMGHNVSGMDALAAREVLPPDYDMHPAALAAAPAGTFPAARNVTLPPALDEAVRFHGVSSDETLAAIRAEAEREAEAAAEVARQNEIIARNARSLKTASRAYADDEPTGEWEKPEHLMREEDDPAVQPVRPYANQAPDETTLDLKPVPDLTALDLKPAPVPSFPPLAGPELLRRMAAIEYPAPRTATRDHYAAVMRRVGEYTGTSTDLEQPATWYWLPGLRSSDLPISWIWQREPVLALPAGAAA